MSQPQESLAAKAVKATQGSFCFEASSKDRVVMFKDKDLKGPVKEEYLKYLEGDDEPGLKLSLISIKILN